MLHRQIEKRNEFPGINGSLMPFKGSKRASQNRRRGQKISKPLPACVSTVMLLLSLTLASCTPDPQQTKSSSLPSQATTIRVSGSGTALPLVQKLAEAYTQKHPETQFQFEPGTNSGGAIRGVMNGKLDLAVVNRPLSQIEAKEALDYRPFARDAVAFVAHKPVPVEALSSSQVRDIYSGKLTNWQQLGGKAAPIVVLDRDPDESARKLVLVPFMNGQPVQAQTVVLSKAKEMVQALESTPNAVGYSSLGLLQVIQARQVQVLKLDGTIPSAKSLALGTYPWYLTFGLVRHRNASPAVQSFVDFTIEQEGRQVLEKYGYTGNDG